MKYMTAGAVALLLAFSFSMTLAVGAVVERLTTQGLASTEGMEVRSVHTSSERDRWHDGKTGPFVPHVFDRWFDEPEPIDNALGGK